MNEIKVIGITGRSGCGKSTVCAELAKMGIAVIDADTVAREVVDAGQPCLADIALEFSIMILNPDGTLNRKKLGEIVFGNREKLIKLNQITFPYINEEINKKLQKLSAQGRKLAVIDAPTLFESGLNKSCDLVAVVVCEDESSLNRIVIRDRISDDQARSRLTSQHDNEFFREHCDIVIENNGSVEELSLKVRQIFGRLGTVAVGG